MSLLSVFLAGFVFAVGLGIGQMTLPTRVIGFLDITGAWDPTLIFVMVGAIIVHALSYPLIMRRPSPVFSEVFHVPSLRRVDWKLLTGSALFGMGWGLAGYCPGPGLVSLPTLSRGPWVFVVAMIAGITVHRLLRKVFPKLG